MCSEYSVVLDAGLPFIWLPGPTRLRRVTRGAGHRVVEVWSDDFDKWVVMDPLMDVHYERDKVPLDALELHSALVGAQTADIAVVQGEKRRATPGRETLVDNYFHITVFLRNNSLSLFDRVLNNSTLSFRDDHTDGRPDLSRFSTTRAQDFAWPLNQTAMAIQETESPRRHDQDRADHQHAGFRPVRDSFQRRDDLAQDEPSVRLETRGRRCHGLGSRQKYPWRTGARRLAESQLRSPPARRLSSARPRLFDRPARWP